MRQLDKTPVYFFIISAVLVRGSGGVCFGEANRYRTNKAKNIHRPLSSQWHRPKSRRTYAAFSSYHSLESVYLWETLD